MHPARCIFDAANLIIHFNELGSHSMNHWMLIQNTLLPTYSNGLRAFHSGYRKQFHIKTQLNHKHLYNTPFPMQIITSFCEFRNFHQS